MVVGLSSFATKEQEQPEKLEPLIPSFQTGASIDIKPAESSVGIDTQTIKPANELEISPTPTEPDTLTISPPEEPPKTIDGVTITPLDEEDEKLKLYKNPWSDLITKAATEYNLDPFMLQAVMEIESNYNDKAVSSEGAVGLMQLMPDTAKRLNVPDRYDPVQNTLGGAKYLRQLLDRYNGNTHLAILAYHAGEGNIDKYGTAYPGPKTQHYWIKYQRAYNKLKNYPEGGLMGTWDTVDKIQQDLKKDTDNKLAWLLAPFVSDAHAVASTGKYTDYEKSQMRKSLSEADKFIEEQGGWDKLNVDQQKYIQQLMDTSQKMIDDKPDINQQLKQDIEKKSFGLNYGDQFNTSFGNFIDLMSVDPYVISQSVLQELDVPVPKTLKGVASIGQSFNRSIAEKFIDTVSLGFIQGNLEKPYHEQSTLEAITGFGGSVLGTILGYSMPWGISGRIIKGTPLVGKVLRSLAKQERGLFRKGGQVIQGILQGYSVGSLEAIGRGDEGPLIKIGNLELTRAETYAAIPAVSAALGAFAAAPGKVISYIKDKALQKFVNSKFVPEELNPIIDKVVQSKSFEEFLQSMNLVNTEKVVKYIQSSTVFGKLKPVKPIETQSYLQQFYNSVRSGKISSLENNIRQYIGSLIRNKKDLILHNHLEKIVRMGGEVPILKRGLKAYAKLQRRPGLIKQAGRSIVERLGLPLGSVWQKLDPVNGSKVVEAAYNEASATRIYRNISVGFLDKFFKYYKKSDFEDIVNILERNITKKDMQRIGNKFEHLVKGAHHLDRWLKVLGEKLKRAGVKVKNPKTDEIKKFSLLKHYFPHRFTPEQLRAFFRLSVTDVEGIGQFLVKTKQAKNIEEAVRLWHGYLASIARKKPIIGRQSFEYTRQLNVPNYRKDPGVLYEYADQTAQRLAFAESYGPRAEKLMEWGVLSKRKGIDGRFIDKAVERITGDYYLSEIPFVKLIRTANMFLFSPGTTAINLAGRANIPVQTGWTAFAKGIANKQKNMAIIKRAGAQDSIAIRQIAKEQVGYDDADHFLGRLKDFYLKSIGWTPTESGNRVDAASAGIELVKQTFKTYTNTKDPKLKNILKYYISEDSLSKASKRGFLNTRDLTKAAQRVEYDTQFWYLLTDLPLAFTSEFGRTLFQFKSSAYLYTRFLKRQVWDELKKGNSKPFFTWAVAGIPANEFTADVRDFFGGKNPFDPEQSKRSNDLIVRSMQDLFFGGQGLGILSDASQAVYRWFNDYTDIAAYEYVGGPTLRQTFNALDIFRDFYRYWNKGQLLSSKAIKTYAADLLQFVGALRPIRHALKESKKKDSRKDTRFKKRKDDRDFSRD